MGVRTTFEEVFNLLKEYKEEHGHCDVPDKYKAGTINLGRTVSNIRTGNRKTTDDQKAMLDSIGFVWKLQERTSFEDVFRLLEEYKAEHGHLNISVDYKVGTINLGKIVQGIRSGRRKTTNEQKVMLDSIGFVWKINESPASFEDVFRLLEEYKAEHGHINISEDYKVGTINLGKIVQSIRNGHRKTTDGQKVLLESIGFVWKVREHISFEEVFRLLSEYKKEHGHCDVPRTEKVGTVNLGEIVQSIRSGHRKTTDGQKVLLESIGFVWKK